MKRKLLFAALLIAWCVYGCSTGSIQDPSYRQDGVIFSYIIENGGISITGSNTKKKTDIKIPEKIEGLPMLKIGSWAFADNQLTSVVIPNSTETFSCHYVNVSDYQLDASPAESEDITGELIGVIGGFEGSNIIVNGRDTIGVQAPIGRALMVDANGEYIYLQSTFPMQTVVKCKVTSGDRSKIKKGMKVYLKP